MTVRGPLQLSLRWLVAAAFGLGSFLLSSVLALATWNPSSGYLLRQREQSAVRQAEVNASVIDDELRRRGEGLDKLLTGLITGPDSTILRYRRDDLRSSGRQIDPSTLPPRLLELTRSGVPARQRIMVDGIPVIAVTPAARFASRSCAETAGSASRSTTVGPASRPSCVNGSSSGSHAALRQAAGAPTPAAGWDSRSSPNTSTGTGGRTQVQDRPGGGAVRRRNPGGHAMMIRTMLASIACLTTGCGVSAQNEPVLITSTGPAEPTPTITIKPAVVPSTTSSPTTPATTATRHSQER